jgi:flagellar hook-associated protein 3 FlgL
MRITQRMMAENAIQRMADNQEKINSLQDKIASTKQFQNASEDPARAATSLSLRSNLRTIESYADTAVSTQNWMNASDNAFQQFDDIAIRANNLILQGLNDTVSNKERATALGAEMQTLLNQAVEVGNTNLNGQYIFSGYQINTKAFTMTDGAPIVDSTGQSYTPKIIAYKGDSGSMQRSLGPEQAITLNVRGDQGILDFIKSLKLASDALMTNNIRNSTTTPPDPNDALTLQTALSGLQSSQDTMGQYRATNGARLRQVESAANFLDTVKIETTSLLSNNEDTNMAEGIALLANQRTTYEAVLQVSQRAISALSLFDYLQ